MDQYLIKMLKLNLHAHSMYQERKTCMGSETRKYRFKVSGQWGQSSMTNYGVKYFR